MVLLSLHGLAAAQIAELLDCHPATVRRWISRFNSEGLARLADRPRSGRPRLGGRRLTGQIAALRGLILVGSLIQLSQVSRGVQLDGDRRWSPEAYRLQVPPAWAASLAVVTWW